MFKFINRAAAGGRGSRIAFGFFFLVLSVTISKPPRMMSSAANYRPFVGSLRHISPQEHFVKLFGAGMRLFIAFKDRFCSTSVMRFGTTMSYCALSDNNVILCSLIKKIVHVLNSYLVMICSH